MSKGSTTVVNVPIVTLFFLTGICCPEAMIVPLLEADDGLQCCWPPPFPLMWCIFRGIVAIANVVLVCWLSTRTGEDVSSRPLLTLFCSLEAAEAAPPLLQWIAYPFSRDLGNVAALDTGMKDEEVRAPDEAEDVNNIEVAC